MTISDTASKFRYQGNGSTDTFAFSGKAFTAAELVVEIITRATDALVETLTITTHYSVTINSNGTATIVTVAGKIPTSLQDIQIRRVLAQSQTVTLPTGTKFPAKSVENAIDRTVGMIQDTDEAIGRALKYAATSSTTDPTLPEPTDDKTIAFDGTTGKFKLGPTTSAISSAATDAAAAASSASSASTSASNASTSASNAATSATAAAASEATVVNEWTFNATTTMADPSSGNIRLNNATLASVTAIAIAANSADTGTPDLSDYIVTWDDSTNAVSGYITIRDASAPQNFAIYSVTGSVTDNTTWLQIAVTHVTSSGSFSGGLKIGYSRAGDIGSISAIGQDIDMNGNQMQFSKGADVASASALPILTDGNYFDVTGTTTVTSINTTGVVGTVIKLHFDGALTLTHHATDLILPGGANITTAAGDEAEFVEYASGDYRCTSYTKADGTAVVSSSGGAWSFVETVSPSAAASADFTSSIDTNGWSYRIIGYDIDLSATAELRIQVYNGSTWRTADYFYAARTYNSTGAENVSGSAAAAGVQVSDTTIGGNIHKLDFTVTNPAATGTNTSMQGNISFDTNRAGHFHGYYLGTAEAHSQIRVIPASGTITGTFKMYKLAAS